MGKVKEIIDAAHLVRKLRMSAAKGRYNDSYIPLWSSYTKDDLEEAKTYLKNEADKIREKNEEDFMARLNELLKKFREEAIDEEKFLELTESISREHQKELESCILLLDIVSSAVDKYDKVGKHYYKMQYVAPKKRMRVSNVNSFTPAGNRCRKDRWLTPDQKYLVVGEFVSTSVATHGTQCYKIQDDDLYVYHVDKDDVVPVQITQ